MFDKLCKKIKRLVVENHLEDVILAVYSYGSLASNCFEKGYSDSDFWFIINCSSIQERIEVGLKLSNIFDSEIDDFINETNGEAHSQKVVHGNLYFTEEEFIRYCKAYPTRVIYPIKKNVWKLAYGKDYFVNIALPDRLICVENLQYDYEFFVHEFKKKVFSTSRYNIRTTIKYFLRAMRTAVWLLYDTYIGTEQELLERVTSIIHDKELLDLFAQIKTIQWENYYVYGQGYLKFYLLCLSNLERYGEKIRRYVEENGFQLINYDKLYRSSLWGCFAWEIAVQVQWYSKILGKPDNVLKREELLEIVIKLYEEYMRYIDEIILSKVAVEDVFCDKADIPIKRSCILNSRKIGIGEYDNILKNEGYRFLLIEHAKRIADEKFNTMDIKDIKKYILNSFLPAVNEVYELLFT